MSNRFFLKYFKFVSQFPDFTNDFILNFSTVYQETMYFNNPIILVIFILIYLLAFHFTRTDLGNSRIRKLLML